MFAALLIVLLAQFAGAFLDALRGHDARLVEIGSAWGFGSTTKSVQAAVVLLGWLMTGLATSCWCYCYITPRVQPPQGRRTLRNAPEFWCAGLPWA